MDEQTTLDAIGIAMAVVGFVSAVGSQFLKKEPAAGPGGRKRLSQAAMLALVVAIASFSGAMATALIKLEMGAKAKVEAKRRDADEATAKRLEQLWKNATTGLLRQANATIRKNLVETLAGFTKAQSAQLETQSAVLLARQRILEQQLQQTTHVIVAGQPLTSLSFEWRLSGSDARLDRWMEEGEELVQENAESSQGGVPRKPFEVVDRQEKLLPLLIVVAQNTLQIGENDWRVDLDRGPVAVMILLDDANNAVLPFGDLTYPAPRPQPLKPEGDDEAKTAPGRPPDEDEQDEATDPDEPEETPAQPSDERKPAYLAALPGAFTSEIAPSPKGGAVRSYPHVVRTGRSYAVRWDLDPTTLASSLYKVNPAIATPSALPSVLRVAVLFNFEQLPVQTANLADIGATGLWNPFRDRLDKSLRANALLRNSAVQLAPNGYGQMATTYRFSRVYEKAIFDTWGENPEVDCFIIEYVRVRE